MYAHTRIHTQYAHVLHKMFTYTQTYTYTCIRYEDMYREVRTYTHVHTDMHTYEEVNTISVVGRLGPGLT